jgi:NADH pyrophosphatase NudC (nudix superfamily)
MNPHSDHPKPYRPSIAALIFDQQKRFLLVEPNEKRMHKIDFVKGGMQSGETKEQTLHREILEELGPNFQYQILDQSHCYMIYDWPETTQNHYRGQARTSFWVKHLGGEIQLNLDELLSHQWVEEYNLPDLLKESGFPEPIIKSLLREWEENQDRFFEI